jgi:hypothetical protein
VRDPHPRPGHALIVENMSISAGKGQNTCCLHIIRQKPALNNQFQAIKFETGMRI